MRPSGGSIGAHDVVIEHSPYGVTLLLQPFNHVFGANQALLFARDCGEEERRAIFPWIL